MKKKLLAMLLAVVMVCGVSGCGKDKTDATDGQQVTAYTVCVLSNEKDMNADTFRTYWNEMTMDAHQVYPLFIL